MLQHNNARREGVTLMEVLAAIFIAGIGLLSLLTLFPLGALKMADAIKDERAAYAGENAKAIANANGIRLDPSVQAYMLGQPDPFNNNYQTGLPPFPPTWAGAGYPVLVDPIGYCRAFAATPMWQNWMSGTTNPSPSPMGPTGIPRCTMSWLQPSAPTGTIIRWTTLLDDMTFDFDGPTTGMPNTSITGFVQRQGRYTWAWFCRMPQAAAPSVVELYVMVFSGRSLDYVGLNQLEQNYSAVFSPVNNVVSITLAPGQARPNLRRGNWILDSTMLDPSGQAYNPRGYFYRIVSVTDTSPTTFDIEVQTPLKNAPQNSPGTIMIFENLVEVFPKGTI
jgi:hypothetical protein